MVMALAMCSLMVGLSLIALWYSLEQSASVKPITQEMHYKLLLDSISCSKVRLMSRAVATGVVGPILTRAYFRCPAAITIPNTVLSDMLPREDNNCNNTESLDSSLHILTSYYNYKHWSAHTAHTPHSSRQ